MFSLTSDEKELPLKVSGKRPSVPVHDLVLQIFQAAEVLFFFSGETIELLY